MILKDNIFHLKIPKGKIDCEWFTFKKGNVIPEDLVNLCLKQGASLEEDIVVKEVKEEIIEKPKKRKFKKNKD